MELHFLDDIPSSQKAPLTQAILAKLTPLLSSSLKDTLLDSLLWMGHDGLLRLGELLGGLRASDVVWGPRLRSFHLRLWRDKTHRSGPSILVPFHTRPGPCAVKSLRILFERSNLWKKPTGLLFPSPRSPAQTISKSSLRLRIKSLVSLGGLDSTAYSGHSLRAGGATDLFVLRVPYAIIKRMGRWRSDACLLYYRDNEDVAHTVASSFRKLAARLGFA